LGAANAAAAFGQGYPVAGGLSQSTVNEEAGARTPLALVMASITIGVSLSYLTGLLTNMPEVILAAIVLVAVKGLIDIRELRRVWELSRTEFGIAMAAFAGVLLFGILKGVLLAAVVSIMFLIRGVALPHVARLGRIPGTDRYTDCERHPDNETISSVLIVRVEGAILYFNVNHILERVRALVEAEGDALHLVVWDLSTSPYVDIAGGRLLSSVQRELAPRGIVLRVVEAHAAVRDLVRKEIGSSLGEISRRLSVHDVVTEYAAQGQGQFGAAGELTTVVEQNRQ
jgi:MFS superfamily sulfate permease-like transporter